MVSLMVVSRVLIPPPLESMSALGGTIDYRHKSLLWEETITLGSNYRHQLLFLEDTLTLGFSYQKGTNKDGPAKEETKKSPEPKKKKPHGPKALKIFDK